MKKLIYEKIPAFSRLFKKLTKKLKSLPKDLEVVKKAVIELHHLHQMNNQATFRLQGYSNFNYEIYKIKKFACRCLKGKGVRSGIRVIYAYFPEQSKIVFIEIYFKQKHTTSESKELIENFLKSL